VILEIVRPGTGDPVADGEVGEVVVTTLNPDYPLIRFGTGDLSAVLPGRCRPAARTAHPRLARARRPVAKVRGMFVHPPQVAEIARRHPGSEEGAAGRERRAADDRMSLEVEVEGAAPEGLAERIAGTIREVTKLRGEVAVRAGQPAERRQGDRGHAQVRLRRAARGPVASSCRP
jgi:phenylacetate-CoA ligase